MHMQTAISPYCNEGVTIVLAVMFRTVNVIVTVALGQLARVHVAALIPHDYSRQAQLYIVAITVRNDCMLIKVIRMMVSECQWHVHRHMHTHTRARTHARSADGHYTYLCK